ENHPIAASRQILTRAIDYSARRMVGGLLRKKTKKQTPEANAPAPNKCLIVVETAMARSSVSARVIGLFTLCHKVYVATPITTITPSPAKSQSLAATRRLLAASAAVAPPAHRPSDNRRLGMRHPKEALSAIPDSIVRKGKG